MPDCASLPVRRRTRATGEIKARAVPPKDRRSSSVAGPGRATGPQGHGRLQTRHSSCRDGWRCLGGGRCPTAHRVRTRPVPQRDLRPELQPARTGPVWFPVNDLIHPGAAAVTTSSPAPTSPSSTPTPLRPPADPAGRSPGTSPTGPSSSGSPDRRPPNGDHATAPSTGCKPTPGGRTPCFVATLARRQRRGPGPPSPNRVDSPGGRPSTHPARVTGRPSKTTRSVRNPPGGEIRRGSCS